MQKTEIVPKIQKSIKTAMLYAITTVLLASFFILNFNQQASAISASTRPTLVGREIHMGPDGGRIKMAGVNVWGIETITLDGFGDDQYADRVNIINTIKSWGANHIRFRLQASDYNAETFMTKAEYLNRIDQWRDLATGAGLYFMPTWWDGHDGPYSGNNWAADYDQAFPMMTDVVTMLGNDPMVFYEPFNEPTAAPTDDEWLDAMKDTARHFREDLNYTGILLIDPRVWSHHYDDARFTNLEDYDATLAGMNGTHQIIFTKHDYANEYSDPDAGFDEAEWATNGGAWNFTDHAVWQSEYGNYNGSPTSVHLPWSDGATTWIGEKIADATLAGGTAFLWGPWLDENAMTAADNTTPTTWGTYVHDNFLGTSFGLNGIGTLGSLIFEDTNEDGVYNPSDGDVGMSNVTVAVYENLTSACTVASGATPLLSTTTDSNGRYEFTLLPTDDDEATNGAGAKYTVVVTDDNNVLDGFDATLGTADTNNNAQSYPTYCVELTNTTSDIQYADFGFALAAVDPDPTPDPDDDTDSNSGSGGTSNDSDGELAETGTSTTLTIIAAFALLTAGGTLLIRLRRNTV